MSWLIYAYKHTSGRTYNPAPVTKEAQYLTDMMDAIKEVVQDGAKEIIVVERKEAHNKKKKVVTCSSCGGSGGGDEPHLVCRTCNGSGLEEVT